MRLRTLALVAAICAAEIVAGPAGVLLVIAGVAVLIICGVDV